MTVPPLLLALCLAAPSSLPASAPRGEPPIAAPIEGLLTRCAVAPTPTEPARINRARLLCKRIEASVVGIAAQLSRRKTPLKQHAGEMHALLRVLPSGRVELKEITGDTTRERIPRTHLASYIRRLKLPEAATEEAAQITLRYQPREAPAPR